MKGFRVQGCGNGAPFKFQGAFLRVMKHSERIYRVDWAEGSLSLRRLRSLRDSLLWYVAVCYSTLYSILLYCSIIYYRIL